MIKKITIKNRTGLLYINEYKKPYEVDIEDVEKIRKINWCVGDKKLLYLRGKIGDKLVYLHRFLLNAPKEKIVDHIDCNIFNNRKSNLRLANKSQNGVNRNKNTLGVGWDKSRNKYRAQIKINYKVICIGRFDSFEEAMKKRIEFEKKLFGEFAPNRKNYKLVPATAGDV